MRDFSRFAVCLAIRSHHVVCESLCRWGRPPEGCWDFAGMCHWGWVTSRGRRRWISRLTWSTQPVPGQPELYREKPCLQHKTHNFMFCVWLVCFHARYPPAEVTRSLETRVADWWELLVGAGNLTWVLCESSQFSQLQSHLSSLLAFFWNSK